MAKAIRTGLFAAMTVALGTLAAAGGALAESLSVIAKAEVDLKQNRQVIDMRKSRGSVVGLRLRAADGRIVLSNVRVTFADGLVYDERRRINLLEGERTRPFGLPDAKERFINEIELFYDRQASAGGKTEIEILGDQTPTGRAATRPPAPATGEVSQRPTSPNKTTAQPGEQTRAGDVLFGAARVGFGVDRDVIRVGAQVGKFQRVRLRVLENDIYINELKIAYADGSSDTLAVDALVDANSVTRWFKLTGDRFVQEIHLNYRSKPSFKGRARVEVFGEYAEGWLGPSGEARRYNAGWTLIGAETAGFVGFDKDVIPIAKNRGGFKKLRVTVRDRAITLDELRIVYDNGREDIVPVKARVDAGSTWGPIDLRERARITEIRARYRSRFIDPKATGKGAAIVEIWGSY
ncbi:MAG: DUF2541 domain-containing protein [Hyphomicrobiaceae bacterium]